jgi:transcriptional regulator with XRE-family HTH domain
MSPGQLLREARRRHGLTQEQLAARARTSQAAISRIERELVSPSVATLASLLDLMNEKLVLDAREVDWGHDKTVLEENLRMTAGERFRRGVSFSRWVERNRGTAQRR